MLCWPCWISWSSTCPSGWACPATSPPFVWAPVEAHPERWRHNRENIGKSYLIILHIKSILNQMRLTKIYIYSNMWKGRLVQVKKAWIFSMMSVWNKTLVCWVGVTITRKPPERNDSSSRMCHHICLCGHGSHAVSKLCSESKITTTTLFQGDYKKTLTQIEPI